MATTYTINATDTTTPAAWMRLATSVTPGAQDSGRCRYTATVDNTAAFEAALDAEESVIDWTVIAWDEDAETAAPVVAMTQARANELFRRGNDAGDGYAPYADVPGDDTIDAAIEAAASDGWMVELRGATTSDVTVLRNGDGERMAIGDVNGPWAVPISEV